MGYYRLYTVVDLPLSADSYMLHNYDQYEFLQVQLPHDELAGINHVIVQVLVKCNEAYCQQLYPTQVAISVFKTC